MALRVTGAFSRGDIPETLRAIDRELGPASYSTQSLFRDDQRMVLRHVLDSTLAEAEAAYLQIHENHAALIQFLKSLLDFQPHLRQDPRHRLRRANENAVFTLLGNEKTSVVT